MGVDEGAFAAARRDVGRSRDAGGLTERERLIQELFLELLDLSAEERAARLAALDPEAQGVRDELEARLRLDQATVRGLDPPPAGVASLPDGTTIGGDRSYRLLRELGVGGMGTVWLAERADGEFDRQVAIKLMAAQGPRAQGLVTRFRVERQILAALDHPGIAKLLDGGSLADGTPYLVMEYVQGERLDEFCARRGLSVRDRVRLFVRICEAVEAAHQRLIVHRDLKPANILVTPEGAPKLLDFGIAKLLDPEAYDWTVAATEHGRTPLTLRYASPEQVQGQPIGTASDVYALGVVLYELLADRSPYDEHVQSLPRLLRAICEHLPTPPSAPTRGVDGGEAEQEPAVELVTRRAALRGDLDAIVLEALRKEPAERYPSVAALAEDLRCYLDGRPVAARAGTGLYRAGKFVRRHRLPILAVVALFLVVTVAAILATVQASLLAAERDRVLAAERRARDEAETARQVSDFLAGLLAPASPETAQGTVPTLRELVDRGASRVRQELAGRPAVQAPLLELIATIYGDLGAPTVGRELAEHALALRRQRRREEPLAWVDALSRLARLRRLEGDLEQAAKASRVALTVGSLYRGRHAEESLAERNRLVVMLMELGDYDQASALLADLVSHQLAANGFAGLPLALEGRRIGQEAEPLARVLHTQGVLAYYQGRFRAAVGIYTEALRLGRLVYGTSNTRIAVTLTALAAAHIDLGEHRTAMAELDEALAIRRQIQGESHPDLAVVLINRAAAAMALGRLDQVVTDSEQAEHILLASVGEEHPNVAAARNNRAEGLVRLGRVDEALALHRRTLSQLERRYPDGHPDLVPTLLNVGTCLAALGRTGESLRAIERGQRMARTLLGEAHSLTLEAELHVGRAWLAAGRRKAGIDMLEALLGRVVASEDAQILVPLVRFELARALLADPGQRERARSLAAQAHAELELQAPGDPRLADIGRWLAAHG